MAALLAAYALRAVMQYIVTYMGHMMGVRIEADIRRDLFRHMQSLSFSFYDKNRTGQLMSRATSDLFEITELAHHGPEDLLISVITLIGAFCLMLTIQWKLALIVCAVVPVFVVFTVFQRRRMVEASLQVKQNMAGINNQLESAISGMRTAKAFANEAQESAKFSRSNDRFKGAGRCAGRCGRGPSRRCRRRRRRPPWRCRRRPCPCRGRRGRPARRAGCA